MDICFCDRSLQRACNSEKGLVRRWGKHRGRTVGKRLQQMLAAPTLDVLTNFPGMDFHALKGNRAGQFAVDAEYPFRLVFEANHNPVPKMESGNVAHPRVTKIRVIEVTNYHGK
jgi:toxin HigB-1